MYKESEVLRVKVTLICRSAEGVPSLREGLNSCSESRVEAAQVRHCYFVPETADAIADLGRRMVYLQVKGQPSWLFSIYYAAWSSLTSD